MRKELFWTAIASTGIAIINLIIYTVLACLNFVEMRYLSYLFLIGFVVCAWLPFLLNLLFKMKIGLTISICYQVFLILSMLVGSLWRVYSLWTPYDKIIHFASGIIIALIGYVLFKESKHSKLSLPWLFVLTFSIALMCGAVWEIWEFSTDIIMNLNSQLTEGLVGRLAIMDTMYDIICDCCGGFIGAVVSVVLEWNKRKNTNSAISTNEENSNETEVLK